MDPVWLSIARTQIGVHEVVGGKGSNPIIEGYQRAIHQRKLDDDIPWCAAFVNWCLGGEIGAPPAKRNAGIEGTRTGTARSFGKWGVMLEKPVPGCIVALWREDPDPHKSFKGHVGFYVGPHADGRIELLGGNQHNEVCVAPFPTERVLYDVTKPEGSSSRVIGYRWPSGVPLV